MTFHVQNQIMSQVSGMSEAKPFAKAACSPNVVAAVADPKLSRFPGRHMPDQANLS